MIPGKMESCCTGKSCVYAVCFWLGFDMLFIWIWVLPQIEEQIRLFKVKDVFLYCVHRAVERLCQLVYGIRSCSVCCKKYCQFFYQSGISYVKTHNYIFKDYIFNIFIQPVVWFCFIKELGYWTKSDILIEQLFYLIFLVFKSEIWSRVDFHIMVKEIFPKGKRIYSQCWGPACQQCPKFLWQQFWIWPGYDEFYFLFCVPVIFCSQEMFKTLYVLYLVYEKVDILFWVYVLFIRFKDCT